MSFRDEMLSSIKTPQEIENSKNNYIIEQCKKSAEETFDKIKYYLKDAVSKGEYEESDGYRRIKIKPILVDHSLLVSYSLSASGVPNRYIENNLLFSTIGVRYNSKWKHNF